MPATTSTRIPASPPERSWAPTAWAICRISPTASSEFTGNALSSFTQSFPLYGALHFRFPSADFYVADEWAVTKNLKLTYGLRLEENFNPTCIEKCFVLTNVPFNSPSYQGGVNIPYNTTLTKSSNLFYNAEGPIVQPRVGFAYKPPIGTRQDRDPRRCRTVRHELHRWLGRHAGQPGAEQVRAVRVELRNGRIYHRPHQLGLHCPAFRERVPDRV